MTKRFIALAALVVLVGFATQAFAQAPAETINDMPLTRAEVVALMVEADPILKTRLRHFIKHRPPMMLFSDVDYTKWYAPYVETAFEAGIITGSDSGTFRPTHAIAEEEMIAIGVRYEARTNPALLNEIAGVSGGSWFNVYVGAAIKHNLDLPFPIRLGQPMKRSDIFALFVSTGIENPTSIAITHTKPTPIVVSQAPKPLRPLVRPVVASVTPRPVVQQPVVQQPRPVVQQPVVQQPRPIQPVNPAPQQIAQQPAPQASAKSFAISMPSLGIKDLTITHPTDPFTKDGLHSVLKHGVGHLFSYPGKGGNILVYGHSSSYPWDVSEYTKIFRQINKLNVGDKIEVTYNGTLYTYQVSKKQTVLADDMSVYQQSNGEELILYTCWPPDSIKERYLVHAKPISQVAVK